MKKHVLLFFILLIHIPCTIHALFDRSYFYRASTFSGEPRLAASTLSTAELQYAGGSTSKALTLCGDCIPVCAYLPCCQHSSSQDIRARIFELNINYYQNFSHGLFFHGHFPMTYALLHKDTKKKSADYIQTYSYYQLQSSYRLGAEL